MIDNKDATLRDKFAMAALMPLAHAGRLRDSVGAGKEVTVEQYRAFAKAAWRLADAMLLERDTSTQATDPLSDNTITV